MEYARVIDKDRIERLPRNVRLANGGTLMNAAIRFAKDKALAKSEGWWPVERAEFPDDGKRYVSKWKLNKSKGKVVEVLAEIEERVKDV